MNNILISTMFRNLDYKLAKGDAEGDAEGGATEDVASFNDTRRAVEMAALALDSAYVGLWIIRLLKKHEWLDSCTIHLSAEAAMGDEGRQFRSTSSSVTDVKAVAGKIPDELRLEGSDELDENSAEGEIGDELMNSEGDLYDGFVVHYDDYEAFALEVKRAAVAHLLDADEISGAEAFAALFPDRASRVEPILAKA